MDQQSKENIRLFMDSLDEKSRRIFWYFRWHRYAKLHELVELVDATSDMEVLSLLNDVINPTALRFFNRLALEFSECRIDSITGKKMLFSWWLLDFICNNEPLSEDGNLVDVFYEEDKIIIVSEIPPSIKVSHSAKVEQRNGILTIRLNKIL